MRYIIITAKHHEGFAMFGSEADSFTIANSPFGRDPMRELADACRAAGLGFGFYYSHFQDWTTPGGARGPEQDDHGAPATFEHYFRSKCLPQVAEITTRYGELWLPGLRSPVTGVHPCGEPGMRLATRQHGSWTVIRLPPQPVGMGPEVYELTVSGALQVDPTPGVDPLLPTALPAAFAAITGAVPHKAQWMEKFGEWKHAEQVGQWGADGVACWTVEFPVAGDWRISVRCRGEGRLVWKCASDEGDFVQNQQGATAAYAVMPLGFLTIQTAGRRTLTLSLLDGNRDSASLESIVVDKGMS
jgi:hypothetical protein